MIYVNNADISELAFDGLNIVAVYCGEDLLWEQVAGDDIWKNTFISRLFLSINGTEVSQTNGDRFEVYTGNVVPGTRYRFTWSGAVYGSENNAPYIRVCFFSRSGAFISPRVIYQATSASEGRYTVTAPENASRIDVRIDDGSSTRRQHFNDFQMFAI